MNEGHAETVHTEQEPKQNTDLATFASLCDDYHAGRFTDELAFRDELIALLQRQKGQELQDTLDEIAATHAESED